MLQQHRRRGPPRIGEIVVVIVEFHAGADAQKGHSCPPEALESSISPNPPREGV